jgi:hypothetical protein
LSLYVSRNEEQLNEYKEDAWRLFLRQTDGAYKLSEGDNCTEFSDFYRSISMKARRIYRDITSAHIPPDSDDEEFKEADLEELEE